MQTGLDSVDLKTELTTNSLLFHLSSINGLSMPVIQIFDSLDSSSLECLSNNSSWLSLGVASRLQSGQNFVKVVSIDDDRIEAKRGKSSLVVEPFHVNPKKIPGKLQHDDQEQWPEIVPDD